METKTEGTICRILFAPDTDYANSSLNAAWVASFADFLCAENTEVDFIARFPGEHALHEYLEAKGIKIIPVEQFDDPSSEDEGGVIARFRARQIISVATDEDTPEYDVVLTQGLSLSRFVAGNGSLQTVHWALIDDHLFENVPKFHTLQKELQVVAENAKIILTTSALLRRQIESQLPASTSKTRLLPVSALTNESTGTLLDTPTIDTETYAVNYHHLIQSGLNYDFSELAEALTDSKRPPRFVLTHFPESPTEVDKEYLQSSSLFRIPGLLTEQGSIYTSAFRSSNTTLLLPSDIEPALRNLTITQAQNFNLACARIDSGIISQPFMALDSDPAATSETFYSYFCHDLADYDSVVLQQRPVRVLLAGADFKFAGDIVDGFVQRRDIVLQVDLFEANAKPQPEKSKPPLSWAEVIVAEFAAKNAIWYSQNVQPHQKLIVHLHGYELLQDWIDELEIENCHRIVFASEFYRAKAIELKEWPEDKLIVIPNSINPGDLERPKHSDARFHLGVVGIVPILKRPDRVLDLLEELLRHDDRYVLHIKGHSPWNYAWEWKKAAHQDSYRKFYSRIGESSLLSQHVVFEPFSPDIGNWLTKIGWILSPSTRETFHLSALEGATSGAVPIAWRREGSEEIIGTEHNIDSLEAAVELVLSGRESGSFAELSTGAKLHASRFAVQKVKSQWLSLVFESVEDSNTTSTSGNTAEAKLIESVELALGANDPEAALAILDENISLTKNSTSLLKDTELYVRGMVALDEKRFTHFLPYSGQPGKSERFILVRPSGASNLSVALSGIDDQVIDVDPPRYFLDNDRYVPVDNTGDPLPDPGTVKYRNESRLRLDRWIQSVKVEVQRFVQEVHRSPYLVAQGPWWIAMPVAFAADELGLEFIWIIDGSDESLLDLTRIAQPIAQSDFRLQSILSVFNRADLRLLTSSENIVENIPYWNIDGYISLDESDPVSGIPSIPSRLLRQFILDSKPNRISQPSGHLLKSLGDLRIGVLGSSAINKDLNNLVKEVREIPIRDYYDALRPDLDAVIIDADANEVGNWKARIEYPKTSAVIPPSKIYDHARVLGASTIFLYGKGNILPGKYFSAARKADTVASNNPGGLMPLLEEHPTSISRLSFWNEHISAAQRWVNLFRSAGIPVSLEP